MFITDIYICKYFFKIWQRVQVVKSFMRVGEQRLGVLNHLKPNIRQNCIYKLISYLTENTFCLHYKYYLVNVAYVGIIRTV